MAYPGVRIPIDVKLYLMLLLSARYSPLWIKPSLFSLTLIFTHCNLLSLIAIKRTYSKRKNPFAFLTHPKAAIYVT